MTRMSLLVIREIPKSAVHTFECEQIYNRELHGWHGLIQH
jgi:hypothetical protein